MKELKRGAKTESLSLRVDPKTKFILEFMVRVKGFRITDLIERAIKQYAEDTKVGFPEKNWLHYWHPEEGIRTINMITDDDLEKSYEEDEIVEFVNQHDEFFFQGSGDKRKPLPAFVQVIWPNIQSYVDHWREHKSTSRWATGTLMLQAIKVAGMKGPEWPRMAPAAAPKLTPASAAKTPAADLDDEIPF